MSTPNDSAQPGRRRFLKGVVAVGGTTVLVAVARDAVIDDQEPQQQAVAKTDTVQGSRGYRETDHIRTYYEKARL